MKVLRILAFFLSLLFLAVETYPVAGPPVHRHVLKSSFPSFAYYNSMFYMPASSPGFSSSEKAAGRLSSSGTGADINVGIKEIVAAEFQGRYLKWKKELLSTAFGRQQWERYAEDKHFLLRIVVSSDKRFGAGTDGYKWDEKGQLVGATITLGRNLDRGYPDPVYYPVMNSLSSFNRADELDGNVLASTKMAHEFGHVNSTSQVDGRVFEKQEQLMTAYYKIFLNNGYNTRDTRLLQLAGELGRRPIEIWEDREYWGEANAMRFLVDRINKMYFYCSFVAHMMQNVNDYARPYEDRFDEIVDSPPADVCRN